MVNNYTLNKILVEVGEMGIRNGSWLVNLLVTLGHDQYFLLMHYSKMELN